MQTIERFCMYLSSSKTMTCEEAMEERQTAEALLTQAKTYFAKIQELVPRLLSLNEEATSKAVELAFLRQVGVISTMFVTRLSPSLVFLECR